MLDKEKIKQIIVKNIQYDGDGRVRHWLYHKWTLSQNIIGEIVRQTNIKHDLFEEIIKDLLDDIEVSGKEKEDAEYIAQKVIEAITES